MHIEELKYSLSQYYDLHLDKIAPIKNNVYIIEDTNFNRYILKFKDMNYNFNYEYSLLTKLKSFGIDACSPLLTLNKNASIKLDNYSMAVYPFIEGQTILNAFSTVKLEPLFMNLGSSIGNLHVNLKKCTSSLELSSKLSSQYIKSYLSLDVLKKYGDSSYLYLCKISDKIYPYCSKFYDKLPFQVIHGDLNLKNIILKTDKAISFIDFDKLSIAPRLLEVCYFIDEIVISSFKRIKLSPYVFQENLDKFLLEYNKIIPFSNLELNLFWYVLLMVQFIFCRYFYHVSIEYSNECIEELFWIYNNKALFENSLKKLI